MRAVEALLVDAKEDGAVGGLEVVPSERLELAPDDVLRLFGAGRHRLHVRRAHAGSVSRSRKPGIIRVCRPLPTFC